MDDPAKATRAADRARIAALDAEIHELQQRIHALQTEQESCQQRLDTYKYPVLTLPNEITTEIFMHFLPPYPTCPPLRGLDSPTTLTHICRKWREIALTSPRLWRAFRTVYTANRAEQTRTVQTWLERSGSCPLSIQMGVSDANCFLALLLHRERWQHVDLELASEDVALFEGPMPLLETLSLGVDDDEYTHPATTVDDFPRLRAVTLGIADHGNWLPISQLTSLTFENVERAKYYLPLLQNAVNLVRLHLIDCGTDVPPGSSVKLARLEMLLMVDFYSDGSTNKLFETFTLPALRTLHMSAALLGQDPEGLLTPFIARSGCKLQEILVTGSHGFSQEYFRAVFPAIPSISFERQCIWYTEEKRELRRGFEPY
ncbi:hypothetical protein FB45DRAFT_999956 [Roridomyces roridus]|uniref:F-box domain-containing protein n=1 Tax=Roridomyces roridus TaxID=1738132 RepID=A0AAD7C7N0_9AGAR|nr:hypothetical protein FB45DRAFT_999956 [Roridomyces roridus]